jgi:transketolase N-terminal domain/subunit
LFFIGGPLINDPKQLVQIATEIRRQNLLLLMNAQLGYIGGDLFITDIHLQQVDPTEKAVYLKPLADKWRSFGWAVREVDGCPKNVC